MKRKFLALLVVASMAFSLSAVTLSAADVDLTKDLVVYYSFDKDSKTVAEDVSGKSNSGVVEGNAQIINGVLGLDGKTGAVKMPDGLYDKMEDITISLWVKSVKVNPWERFLSAGVGGDTYMILTPYMKGGWEGNAEKIPDMAKQLNLIPGSTRNQGLSLGLTKDSWGLAQSVGVENPFTAGQWHIITVTLKGDTATMYMDGDEISKNEKFSNNPKDLRLDKDFEVTDAAGKVTKQHRTSATINNYLGRSVLEGDPFSQSFMDEVRIYSRALNADEVKALASITPGKTENKSATVAIAPVKGFVNDALDFTPGEVVVTFPDIKGHWGQKYIEFCATKAIINGYPEDGTFRPDNNITRAEFITLVIKAAKLPEKSYKNTFGDVAATDWYAKILQTASDARLIDAAMIENGNISPNRPITREEMASIIVKAYVRATAEDVQLGDLTKYTDNGEISEWAKGNAAQADNLGFITGTTATTFAPKANATRAQVATIIQRFVTKVNK